MSRNEDDKVFNSSEEKANKQPGPSPEEVQNEREGCLHQLGIENSVPEPSAEVHQFLVLEKPNPKNGDNQTEEEGSKQSGAGERAPDNELQAKRPENKGIDPSLAVDDLHPKNMDNADAKTLKVSETVQNVQAHENKKLPDVTYEDDQLLNFANKDEEKGSEQSGADFVAKKIHGQVIETENEAGERAPDNELQVELKGVTLEARKAEKASEEALKEANNLEIRLWELVNEAADVGITCCLFCEELFKLEKLTLETSTLTNKAETILKKFIFESEHTGYFMMHSVKDTRLELIETLRSDEKLKNLLSEINQLATTDSGLEADISEIEKRRETFEEKIKNTLQVINEWKVKVKPTSIAPPDFVGGARPKTSFGKTLCKFKEIKSGKAKIIKKLNKKKQFSNANESSSITEEERDCQIEELKYLERKDQETKNENIRNMILKSQYHDLATLDNQIDEQERKVSHVTKIKDDRLENLCSVEVIAEIQENMLKCIKSEREYYKIKLDSVKREYDIKRAALKAAQEARKNQQKRQEAADNSIITLLGKWSSAVKKRDEQAYKRGVSDKYADRYMKNYNIILEETKVMSDKMTLDKQRQVLFENQISELRQNLLAQKGRLNYAKEACTAQFMEWRKSEETRIKEIRSFQSANEAEVKASKGITQGQVTETENEAGEIAPDNEPQAEPPENQPVEPKAGNEKKMKSRVHPFLNAKDRKNFIANGRASYDYLMTVSANINRRKATGWSDVDGRYLGRTFNVGDIQKKAIIKGKKNIVLEDITAQQIDRVAEHVLWQMKSDKTIISTAKVFSLQKQAYRLSVKVSEALNLHHLKNLNKTMVWIGNTLRLPMDQDKDVIVDLNKDGVISVKSPDEIHPRVFEAIAKIKGINIPKP